MATREQSTPDPAGRLDPRLDRLAGAVAAAIVETLAGRRSLYQLEGWLDQHTRELLVALCRTQLTPDLRLRAVRVQQPLPGRLEVSAHLVADGRSRAAAFRLERRNGRWIVSSLEVALQAGRPYRAREAA